MPFLLFAIVFFVFASSADAIVPDAIEQDQSPSNNQPGDNDTAYGAHTKGYAMDDVGATEINSHSAQMLYLEGEESFRSRDLDTAMRKVKKSLDLDNDNMDAHLLYANILDEKVHAQTEKDPTLFNCCVKEWLAIMREQFGEEKNMRFHGVNPFGDLYHDEERATLAKRALVKLTGFAPKTFESNAHYLKRVLRPEKTI